MKQLSLFMKQLSVVLLSIRKQSYTGPRYIPLPSSSIGQLKEFQVKALVYCRTLLERQVILNLNRTKVPSCLGRKDQRKNYHWEDDQNN